MSPVRQWALHLAFWLLCGVPATAQQLFEVKPVTDGVYAAIAQPTFRTNANAVIVLLDDGVLLVDAESKPSAAEELIGVIRRLTDKPLKYLVITHFHADHTQGAEAYLKAWPQAEIVASENTRSSITLRGAARMNYEESTAVPQQIDHLRSDLGHAIDRSEKERIEGVLREANSYRLELRQIRIPLPTITVNSGLRIERKKHPAEILWLGKAHTDGDLFVFLPKDKVLITGDALHSLTPTMRDSYPADWIETLAAAEKLDFDYVIGGHGDVFRGKATLRLWKQYFGDLLDQTSHAFAAGATLDQARKQIIPLLLAKYAEQFPKRFSETIVSNVEKAYRVASGATD